MRHMTPSPNTQSRTSVKFRAVILVLSKHFFLSFTRVFHLKQRRPKTHTPTRHRRTTTVIRGSGIPVVRFMFWKEDTQARTPVPSPETWRSRPARTTPVLNRAFLTTTRTGTSFQSILVVRTRRFHFIAGRPAGLCFFQRAARVVTVIVGLE